MKLIGLLGKKRSGKDTVADFLKEKYQYKKMAFADKLKSICREMFGFTDQQLYTDDKEKIDDYWNISPRHALQFIGTDLIRSYMDKLIPHIKNNFWVKVLEKEYLDTVKNFPEKYIVISDVRFENEVDFIHKYGGTVIKLERESEYDDVHISEKGIDDITNYDILIHNNSTLDALYEKIVDNLKL